MLESQGKLLFAAFFSILIGVVLIQPISNDIELAGVSSYSVTNESVTLTGTTGTITNETLNLTSGENGTLDHFNISAVTEIRNFSSTVITSGCNVTYATGFVKCNLTVTDTTNRTYFDYTYVSGKTATLGNDHLIAVSALRNVSSEDLLSFCNVTLRTGGLVCNNILSFTCYADYTYNAHSTGTLANDELNSFDACRNTSMTDVPTTSPFCNVTLISGAVRVDYDNFTDGTAYIDYTYEPDTYIRSSAARVMLSNTRLFFAIAIILLGIGFAVASFKQGGVM